MYECTRRGKGVILGLILVDESFVLKVRDGLQQLLDDDDDMADLYLARKLTSSSPLTTSRSVPTLAKLFLVPPSMSSRQSRASKASTVLVPGDEYDIAEVEMLLEVLKICHIAH